MADAGGGSSAFARFVGSSAAALVAETFTLPTDVAKTRLQTDSVGRYKGSLVTCLRSTAGEEGVGALVLAGVRGPRRGQRRAA